MLKIGLSSCGYALTDENFAALKNAGVDAIEIVRSLEDHKNKDCKEIRTLADRHGVTLWSYHLPFAPFSELEISTSRHEVRKFTVELYTEIIKKASASGVDKFIIHPSGEPIAPERREDKMLYSMQSLDILAEVAHSCGAQIAVEDLPRTCLGHTADEVLRLVSANDKLRVCFDTNHLLEYNDNNLNFLEKLGDKIITLHVSDYDFLDEKHWLPGEGRVDWQELYAAILKTGYRGVWMYEIGLTPPKTLNRSRNLTFEDFVRNAHEIFENKTFTVIK